MGVGPRFPSRVPGSVDFPYYLVSRTLGGVNPVPATGGGSSLDLRSSVPPRVRSEPIRVPGPTPTDTWGTDGAHRRTSLLVGPSRSQMSW